MQDYRTRRGKSRRFSLRRRAHPPLNPLPILKTPGLTPLPKRPRPARGRLLTGGWRRIGQALRGGARLRRVPVTALFTLGLLWLVGGMAWGVWRAWELPLDALEISGTEKITAVQVAAAAGLYPGLPVGGLDPLAMAERLLQHPRIARADVRRMIPGRLEIRIAERRAAALALLEGGHTALVDREGIVLETDPAPEAAAAPALPRIQGGAGAAVEGGRVNDATLRRGLALAETAVSLAPLAGERLGVDARDPFAYRLVLESRGRTLILPARGAEPALRAYLAAERALAAAMPEFRTADLRAVPRQGPSWIALSR